MKPILLTPILMHPFLTFGALWSVTSGLKGGAAVYRLMMPNRKMIAMIVLVAFFAHSVGPAYAAKSAVKLTKLDGQIDFSEPGPQPFVLEGIASHLGQFTAYGEATFEPGPTPGTMLGSGIVVFTASNGDQLVGDITWTLDGSVNRGDFHTKWSDSVQFDDGTVVSTTGRFVKDKPPGALVGVEMIFVTTFVVLGLIRGLTGG